MSAPLYPPDFRLSKNLGFRTYHLLNTAGQEWVKVGTVVGGGSVGSSGRKVEYNGASYDYVFDVAIEEGTPALKLPFNLSDNPHSAAAKFIADNELPQGYHDQVVNFIIKNTQGQTIGSSSSAQPTGSDSGFQPSSRKIIPLDKYLFLTSAKFDRKATIPDDHTSQISRAYIY